MRNRKQKRNNDKRTITGTRNKDKSKTNKRHLKQEQDIKVRIGRTLLPPISKKYLTGAYNESEPSLKEISFNPFLIISLYSIIESIKLIFTKIHY